MPSTAQRIQQWNSAMLDQATDDTRRGTHWLRGLAILTPTTAVTAALAYSIAGGAVAATFNVADQPLTAHIESVEGNGLAAVIGSVNSKDEHGNSEQVGTLHAAISSGTLRGVCIIAHEDVMGVGYSIIIEAAQTGEGTGENLTLDATEAEAFDVTAQGLNIGRSADEIFLNGKSLGGRPGGIGIDGPDAHVVLKNVTGTAWSAELVGAIKASDFKAAVKPGKATSC